MTASRKPLGWILPFVIGIPACAHLPPVAQVIPRKLELHGDVRIDDYYWLREKDNPRVIEYIKAENEYTRVKMKHTEPLQEKLYKEMLARIKETDLAVPYKHGDYFYYTKTEEGKQYKIYCRKKGGLEAAEEILLDENQLATGKEFFRLGYMEVSPNHQLLAYAIDTSGAESYSLFFKDLSTGKLLDDRITGVYYGLAWANDNRTVFYTVHDETMRPDKVLRHQLGTDPKVDVLVFQENDKAFRLYLGKSRSKAYIGIHCHSTTSDEVHVIPAERPTEKPRVIQPRTPNLEYRAVHHTDKFFIVTNDNAKNFKLVEAPVDNPSRENWKEVISHRPDVKVDDLDVFREHLVVYERKDGLKQVRITYLPANQTHYLEFPEPTYEFWPDHNPEFDSHVLRYKYTSLITPDSIFDYDMNTKMGELKKEEEVLGGYDRTKYSSQRIFAQASDGTRIPISLVHRKDLQKNGKNPLYMKGYGSYGASYDPEFSSNHLSLLDRGFVVAIAHIRGGGEMGRSWYEQGKLLNKMNTFTDFITCSEHLISEGYTGKDRLVVTGGSAGGLLMGVVLNLRPDLFRVVVADVPFVDVVTTMLDESIPLTTDEFEEWGNPKRKEHYEYMKSYSPYDNVEAKAYPDLLITAGLNDSRVQYWEPAKWTARLRAKKTDQNLLLLRTKMIAGHSGPSGRYDSLREVAFEYAFIFDRLGIKQ